MIWIWIALVASTLVVNVWRYVRIRSWIRSQRE